MRAQTRVNKKHWPAQWGWPQTALLTDTGTKAVNRVPLSSHTERRMSQCTAALVLCLYSVYSFCPPPLFHAQWGLKSRGSEGGRMARRSPRQPAVARPALDGCSGKPGDAGHAAPAPPLPALIVLLTSGAACVRWRCSGDSLAPLTDVFYLLQKHSNVPSRPSLSPSPNSRLSLRPRRKTEHGIWNYRSPMSLQKVHQRQ